MTKLERKLELVDAAIAKLEVKREVLMQQILPARWKEQYKGKALPSPATSQIIVTMPESKEWNKSAFSNEVLSSQQLCLKVQRLSRKQS